MLIINNDTLAPSATVEDLPLNHDILISLEALTITQDKNKPTNPTSAEITAYLAVIFGDRLMPHFFAIAKCESTLRQWDSEGNVLLSGTGDAGILQVHLKTWLEKSREMGLNILDSWQDNIKMSKYIFDHQTATAWTCRNKI